MEKVLLEYISKFPSLTEEEVKGIVENLTVRSYKKGTVLLKEGEINKECYFVLKGCLRQYYIVDGEEKTTEFLTEEQGVGSVTSYLEQSYSDHYLTCVEDCILIVGNMDEGKDMYEKFPKLEIITRAIIEQDFGKTKEALAFFITSTPEERYLNLLETRPDLLQRVPQHQIASYLGVSPESLSRIRKRVSLKHK
jgi:CRP-like cAMP-binding protein